MWRSILRARYIVRDGVRWCIGLENSIPILDEPWHLSAFHIDWNILWAHYVCNFSINSLIDISRKSWNHNIASAILGNSLQEHILDNKLIWKEEKNGLYSVKCAYWICVEVLVATSHIRRLGYWYGIWCLNVPPKVKKSLVWRMCRGCIPRRVRLRNKGVKCYTSRVSCDSTHEDLTHIIF